MSNIKTFFDWLKHINQYKTPSSKFNEEDWNLFNPFMIHKALSQDPENIELVDYIQGLDVQDKKTLYIMYSDFIPKNKKWNGWVKSKTKSRNSELIGHISEHYEVSKKIASEYLTLLEKSEVESILSGRGIDAKDIKKLIK